MTTIFTWFGHATLGLETDGHKLLIDPFFTGNPVASATADEVELAVEGYYKGNSHIGSMVKVNLTWYDADGAETLV